MTREVCDFLKAIRSKNILRRGIAIWIAFAALVVASHWSIAQGEPLRVKTSFVEDAGNQKSVADIQSDSATPFEGFLSRGYSNSTYWIRIDISNAPTDEPLVLTVSPYYLDDIALFDPISGLKLDQAGIRHSPSEQVRAFLPHTFLLPYQSKPEAYWLRIRSRSSIIANLNIMPLAAAYIAESKHNFLSAFYIGCILMFAVIGVALAWRSNDPATYFFPIYEVGAAIFALNLFGYFGLWLRPAFSPDEIARIHQLATVIAALTAGIFHTLFLRGLGVGKAWLTISAILILINFSEFGLIAADFVQLALRTNAVFCLIYPVLFLLMAISLPNRRKTGEFPKNLIVIYYAIFFVIVALMALQLQGIPTPIDNVFFGNVLYGFATGFLMLGMLTWRTLRVQEREHETKQGLALAVDGARLGVWRFHPQERDVSVSNKFAKDFGLPANTKDVSYDKILSVIHADDRAAVDDALNKSITEKTDFVVEHRVVWPDGSEHWIYGHGRPTFADDGSLKQIDGITINITDRKLNELKYIESLGTINAAFASMSEGIIICDTHGNVIDKNSAASVFLRIEDSEQITWNDSDFISQFISRFDLFTLDGRQIQKGEGPYALALKGISQTNVYKVRSKQTGEAWYGRIGASPIYGDGNEIKGAALTAIDITERIELQKNLEEKVKQRTAELMTANRALAEMSRHDALTGLNNRLACSERLRSEFERMKRTGEAYSLLMADIDLFKHVNDSCGHVTGDAVLKFVADTMSDNLREYDFLARWGGEEFLVLLPATDLDQAFVVAEKLRLAVEAEPHSIAGKVTISIGVTIASPNDLDEDLAVMGADEALYKAKDAGRNCVVAKRFPATVVHL